jgi:amidase
MGKNVHPDVLKALDETVRLLIELGHEVVEATPPVNREDFSMAFLTVLAGELRADIEETARANREKVSVKNFDPGTFGLGMLGKAISAQEYASATRYLQTSAREIARFCEDYSLLLTPTLSQPPVKIGSLQPADNEKTLINLIGSFDGGNLLKMMGLIKPLAAQTFEFMPWTAVFNVTGQPAMSVPLHWNAEGLPIGMHFIGKFGDEATLFRLAAQLEQAKPWAEKIPAGYD